MSFRLEYTLFIPLFLFVSACTQEQREVPSGPDTHIPERLRDLENLTVYPADEEPVFKIQLIRDQVFPESEDLLVGMMAGITVDDMGRVFITDGEQNTVHVFHPDGSYITNIGRSGQGPGEFGSFQLGSPIFHDSARLYVYDPGLRRINIFSLETLESVGTVNLSPESIGSIDEIQHATPMPHSVRHDSSFIVTFAPWPNEETERFTRYYQMDLSGKIHPSEEPLFTGRMNLLLSARSFMTFPSFFSRRTLMDVSTDDHIYSAWSDELLVKIYDPDGNYLRAFYHPFTNRELTREGAIVQASESARNAVRNFDDLPDTWPALYSLQVDDEGRIWIATITDDDDTYNYWVFHSSGELLARFDWPKVNTRFFGELQIQEIRNNHLYIRETEEDTGLDQIVRYRIEMEESE